MQGERPSPEEQALLSAYEAGDATPEERRRVEALLGESVEARVVLARLRALREASATVAYDDLPAGMRGRVLEAVLAAAHSRPASRRRWGIAALMVPAVAAVALAILAPGDPPSLPPAPAPAIAGEVVRTGGGDYRLVPIGERGVAFVGEDSEVVLGRGGADVEIRRGSVRLVVRNQRRLAGNQPFVVTTPAAEVAVLGTEFDVAVTTDATSVHVVRGEVEVRNEQGRRVLWANETARARRGETPRLVEKLKPVVLDGPAEILMPPTDSPRRRRRD